MIKKITTLMVVMMLSFSLVGCSKDGSSSNNDTDIVVKDIDDFKESDGKIKYFTIDGNKISIPETVGEYVNYLSQIGEVTLNDTGRKVEDVELEAGAISSMVAYLNVETKDGDEGHFYIRYENTTDKTITVKEATITFIEVKYDVYSEMDYDRAINGIEVVTQEGTLPIDNKMGYHKVKKIIGEPNQETDGRLRFMSDDGFEYMFDCCIENRNGIFRGFSITYPVE